ncbi:MAG: molybdopterin-dependent oxidoreductase [Myxococcales bacterium]|nr:molybdopterin-dependent oxidoreductase [Myxococcales bacterium]
MKDGEVFREASWEEALSRAAHGLAAVRKAHGRDALAVYQGNPVAHNLGLLTVGQAVLRSFRTKNLYSASTADQAPHMLAAEEMFGNPVLMPVPDLDRTAYLLIVGANPVVSNGSIMTAPDMKRRLAEIRARGGKVVVVDPRRTETAEVADRHVFVRPASDPWFLLGVLHFALESALARPPSPSLFTGFEELRALARSARPEDLSRGCGVPTSTMREIAESLVTTERATVYGRVGICHQEHGSLAAWLVYALNAVTGHLDTPGGAMFTTPAVEIQKLVRLLGFVGHDRWRSRVRGLSEVAGELPIATLADEIETPGRGQVRALLTCAGNPVLSAPNGARIDRALPGLEFMVSVDSYVNETTRHADVILPPVAALERDHYDVALNGFAVRNVAKFVRAPVEREPRAPYDWEILLELAARMRTGSSAAGVVLRRTVVSAVSALGPSGVVEIGLRVGPHRLSLRKLADHPHGLDLGPLTPRLPQVLETKDGRVALAPAKLMTEARRLFCEPVPEVPALVLIGRRHLRSNNSWLHNAAQLVKGKPRCTLLMHPDDASRRGLADGDRVSIASRVGRVEAPLEVSDCIMPGVVSLPHGFGHDRARVELAVARAHAGVSVNDITDDALVDRLSGNAAFSGVPVVVSPV